MTTDNKMTEKKVEVKDRYASSSASESAISSSVSASGFFVQQALKTFQTQNHFLMHIDPNQGDMSIPSGPPK